MASPRFSVSYRHRHPQFVGGKKLTLCLRPLSRAEARAEFERALKRPGLIEFRMERLGDG